MSRLEEGRIRLGKINWTVAYDYELQDSHVKLVKEFLLRIAQWANALECNSEWPLIDVAAKVDKKRRYECNAHELDQMPIGAMVCRACDCYLRWMELSDHDLPLAYGQLPEPFEPLIVAFESGLSSLRRESGLLMVECVGIRISGGPSAVLRS
ncbi:MAG: hypothetical protein ABJZ55_22210 [Fuerstiella sp.]